jgi:chorismate dehydratase
MGHCGLNLAGYHAAFAASLRFGLAHIDDIAAEYALKLGMTPSAVKVYLTQNIDYSLDEENHQGLKLFYKLAHEVGIVPTAKELHFA